jgi:ribose/xylose/arabinose/galactoside ABC-type transport system permease subunit
VRVGSRISARVVSATGAFNPGLARFRSGDVAEHGALVVVVLVVGVVAALRAPVFLSTSNLLEILRSTSTYFVMGCGAT